MSKEANKYKKLDPISHIHKRPDMYVGTIRSKKEIGEWVIKNLETLNITKHDVSYSQALLRIFVEALSNAIDNVWRSEKTDTPVTKIKITLDKDTGLTSVWNDGLGIPIQKNEDHDIWVPELIFGHLLSGSNYDDNEKRFSSGRNGLGIKLTNVFSKEFNIHIVNTKDGKSYKKKWYNNMKNSDKEVIKSSKLKNSFTQVSWVPDFEKFNIKNYTHVILSVYYRYILDAAMITGVNIFLNDKKIVIKNLTDYVKYYPKINEKEIVYMKSKDCDVIVTPSDGSDFEQISFTNGVFNKDGGVHVEQWTKELFKPLLKKLNKPKKPHVNVKDIKKYFRIFIKCKVANPEFSSQSKTYFSSPEIHTNIQTKNINAIMKWSIIENIKDIIKSKELLSLKKVEKRSKSFKKIEGFDPANNAGGKLSSECTLILTEGLSAKTYAVTGIQVGLNGKSGRDWYGIYPLRGKLLNVRNASLKSITKNKEITDVIQALGLRTGVDYTKSENFKKLNYGKVMIMTDADVDGIHICSLILNFFHKLFPTLFKRKEPYLTSMQTPIVKVFLQKKQLLFYREQNFNLFNKQNSNKKFKIKYYKGLGTSSDKEIKETFGKKIIQYNEDDKLDQSMNKAFHSKSSNIRKTWLSNYDKDNLILDVDKPVIDMNISDYIDNELIKFSIDDCHRSIPNMFDGLKTSHRKILYATFKKNLKPSGKSMKVAQLAGYVAEHTNYHHGEQCLFETITKMAQDFPGSNNIPYLQKDGQFGSRLNGGKDAANARYIYTKLHKLTRLIYPEDDDVLLNYLEDDGDIVEPEFFIPIIPMILVNGCSAGIGTGWSCSLPSYNPLELVECIEIWIQNQTIFENDEEGLYSLIPELKPWYNNYTGKIEKVDNKKYVSYGNCIRDDNKRQVKVVVDELPISMWTEKFKSNAEDLLENKKIKNLKNYSTPDKVKFVITESIEMRCDVNTLKLKTYLSTSNMVLFTENSKLKKFETIDDIIEEFCKMRYKFYILRKKHQLKCLEVDLKYLKNKLRFLTEVINKQLVINNREEYELITEMSNKKYDKRNSTYDYLLNMNIRSFTKNKIETLKKEIEKNQKKINTLQKTSEKKLWLQDLNKFVKEYSK